MTKRLEIQKVIEECNLRGDTLLSTKYINNHSKLEFQCGKCDNKFWMIYSAYHRGERCSVCANNNSSEKQRKSYESVYNDFKSHGLTLLEKKYKNNRTPMKTSCNNCGRIWTTSYDSIKEKRSCPVCAISKRSEKQRKNYNDVLNIFESHGFTLLETNYKNVRTPMKTKCNICKKYWYVRYNDINKGEGCPICAGKIPTYTNNLLILYPWVAKEWDYSKNKKRPEDYLSKSHEKVHWICCNCDHKFNAIIKNRTGLNSGCPACKISGGAKRIYHYLKINNFEFDIEYNKFQDLLSYKGNPLIYDFAIFNNKDKNIPDYLIEFDGGQHENFIPIFYKTVEDFQIRKEYDKLKDKYAINHNIPLLRINHKDINNIEKILDENLSEGIFAKCVL